MFKKLNNFQRYKLTFYLADQEMKTVWRTELIFVILALTLPACTPKEHCKYTNLYLEILERRSYFVLLESPTLNSTKCSPEWTLHGTCCRDEDVIRYGNYKIKESKTLKENREKEFNEIKKQLAAFSEKNCIVTSSSTTICDSLKPEIKEKAAAKNLMEYFDRQIRPLFKLIPEVFDKIDANKQQCDQSFFNMKLKALCSICSGRGDKFFNKNKLLLNELDCRQLIGSCFDFWKVLMDGLKLAKNYMYYLKIFLSKLGVPSAESQGYMYSMYYLNKWADSPLREFMAECPSADCEFTKAASLCSHIVRIVDPVVSATNTTARSLRRLNGGSATSRRLDFDPHEDSHNEKNEHSNSNHEVNHKEDEHTKHENLENNQSSDSFLVFAAELDSDTHEETMPIAAAVCRNQALMDQRFGVGSSCSPVNLTLAFP